MEFQAEKFFDCLEEAKPLMQAHAEEAGRFPADQFALNLVMYEAVENVGLLRTFSAREDGKLVGYATFFITPHTHYRGVIVAVQDGLFFDPKYRGFSSIKFLKWCDEYLRDEGVNAVSRHVTTRKDYGKVLERLGYDRWEMNYIREFKEIH